MKLSDNTLTLLKNFSNINQSILFKQGKSLRTISVMKNILAEATINEELPKDFGIYDLNQFLNGLSLHNNPDLDFENEVKLDSDYIQNWSLFLDLKILLKTPFVVFVSHGESANLAKKN